MPDGPTTVNGITGIAAILTALGGLWKAADFGAKLLTIQADILAQKQLLEDLRKDLDAATSLTARLADDIDKVGKTNPRSSLSAITLVKIGDIDAIVLKNQDRVKELEESSDALRKKIDEHLQESDGNWNWLQGMIDRIMRRVEAWSDGNRETEGEDEHQRNRAGPRAYRPPTWSAEFDAIRKRNDKNR